jgi:XRE family transcriptional regulator, regulator of sulfur utilization
VAAKPALDMTAIGRRIRALRRQRDLSLETLAERSGVSVSMLSTVERGQKVPSILVMGRIATALDTSIGRLLDEETSPRVIVMRAPDQRVIKDGAGIERRSLSPILPGVEFELMRMILAPGIDAGTFPPHRAGSREYLAIERGTLTLTLAGTEYVLRAGDSIYHAGDLEHGYRNDGRVPCAYYLAMDVAGKATWLSPAHRLGRRAKLAKRRGRAR